MTGKLGQFARLAPADKWLFIRAVYWLGIARIWILAVPFPRLTKKLNKKPQSGDPDSELLDRVAYAVGAAAGHVPWRSDCFPQAIAACKLLQRSDISSEIHLGVDNCDEVGFLAHAWLTCGDRVVVGGADLDRYEEIHSL